MFRRQILGIATLSASTLLLETTLTRLLAVAQFYHFAFLVISLALLGFGASGTLLSVNTRLQKIPLERMLNILGIGFFISVGLAYGVINLMPFDSYSIAWDRRQIFLFVLYYLVLTLPFIISGLGVGAAIAQGKRKSHLFYASNLVGSSIGALLAPIVLYLAGVSGAVVLSAILGSVVSLIAIKPNADRGMGLKWSRLFMAGVFVGGILIIIIISALNFQSHAPLGMTISPYKGLAQALRFPDAETIFNRWNAISRLDMVANGGTHQMPGLSYLYPEVPPGQLGLSIDADALQAVTLTMPEAFDAGAYLPESIAFEIIPDSQVLVLNPGGGLGVIQSLAGRASQVTAVMDNALIPKAIASTSPNFNIYAHSKVRTVIENDRVFLRQQDQFYDIIFTPLTDPFRPVSSGAYSLAEDYSKTIGAFVNILSRLKPGGIFIYTRWMQEPPSESLRAIAITLEALEQAGAKSAADTLVVYRGIQTVTVIVRPSGWSRDQLTAIREFTNDRKFDLVWLPDIQASEVNRFNRLPEPDFYLAVQELVTNPNRQNYYDNYQYDISPPTDDDPFFYNFFKWEQTPQVLATLGQIWQPFGGSGYLVLLALLILTIVLSLGLIVVPMIWRYREMKSAQFGKLSLVLYFGLLGTAFMFVEIPLIQRAILVFGHPTYAFTIVVAILLCSSAVGSALTRSKSLNRYAVTTLLILFTIMVPIIITHSSGILLDLSVGGRVAVTFLGLVPIGVLMGMPFPMGIAWLEERTRDWVPMAWAVNGCLSVVASVLAAVLSLNYGFTIVLFLGAAAYTGAAFIYLVTMKNQ